MSKHFGAKKGIATLLSVLSTCGAVNAAGYGDDSSIFRNRRYSINSRPEFDTINSSANGVDSGARSDDISSSGLDSSTSEYNSPRKRRRRRRSLQSTTDQQSSLSGADSSFGNGDVLDSNGSNDATPSADLGTASELSSPRRGIRRRRRRNLQPTTDQQSSFSGTESTTFGNGVALDSNGSGYAATAADLSYPDSKPAPLRKRRMSRRSRRNQQLTADSQAQFGLNGTGTDISNGVANFNSGKGDMAPAPAAGVESKGTWNPFKVGYEGIKGAYHGIKGLNLTTWQKVFAGLTLGELTLYLTVNKGMGELMSGLIFDTVVTNLLKIKGKEGMFADNRVLYNNSLASQNAIIDKMPPVINAVARLFSCFKGNWIDWAVALVCGLMGKEKKDVCETFANDDDKKAFGKATVDMDMSLAKPEDTKVLLKGYFKTVGAKFRPTRINMLFYNVGSKINKAVKKGMAPGGNPTA